MTRKLKILISPKRWKGVLSTLVVDDEAVIADEDEDEDEDDEETIIGFKSWNHQIVCIRLNFKRL